MTKNKMLLLEQSTIRDLNRAFEVSYDFSNILDESWLFGNTSRYFKKHYYDHVLQPGEFWEEFPEKSSDGEYRIKMPEMSPLEYERRADALAMQKNVYSYKDKDVYARAYIGGIAVTPYKEGGLSNKFVKIRKNSDQTIDAKNMRNGSAHSLNNMCEAVVYIKAPDNSNYIITYMMARNLSVLLENIRFVDDLPPEENAPEERITYYLCVDKYQTTGGENYIETKKFNTYKEATEYFSNNKKTSKLIKVDKAEKKTMSEKNPKKVIPEIKNKDGTVSSQKEAIYLLNRNNYIE